MFLVKAPLMIPCKREQWLEMLTLGHQCQGWLCNENIVAKVTIATKKHCLRMGLPQGSYNGSELQKQYQN